MYTFGDTTRRSHHNALAQCVFLQNLVSARPSVSAASPQPSSALRMQRRRRKPLRGGPTAGSPMGIEWRDRRPLVAAGGLSGPADRCVDRADDLTWRACPTELWPRESPSRLSRAVAHGSDCENKGMSPGASKPATYGVSVRRRALLTAARLSRSSDRYLHSGGSENSPHRGSADPPPPRDFRVAHPLGLEREQIRGLQRRRPRPPVGGPLFAAGRSRRGHVRARFRVRTPRRPPPSPASRGPSMWSGQAPRSANREQCCALRSHRPRCVGPTRARANLPARLFRHACKPGASRAPTSLRSSRTTGSAMPRRSSCG